MADQDKKLIIQVGLDATEASQGVDQLKEKIGSISNVDASKSVKSFKTEIREATLQAKAMEEQFGRNSSQFAEAAKKVAGLKDRFSEFNDSVGAFNPDNKLQSLVSLAKGATGAIQGATGAMAFLGIESDKASETIARLQGLMAFSQALSSLDDIKNSFKNFATVLGFTKTQADASAVAVEGQSAATQGATLATKGFGAAFKAIGIGLIISAIAYLASNFDSVKESVSKALPFLNNLGEIFNKVKTVAFGVGNAILKFVVGPVKAIIQTINGDFSGALDTLKNMADVSKNYQEGAEYERKAIAEDARKERLKKEVDETKNHIEVLKARGKDTYALEKENLSKRLSVEKEGSDEFKKLKQEQAVFEAGHQKKLDDDREKGAEKAKQEGVKRAADAKQRQAELKAEGEKLKAHYAEVQKIIDDAHKNATDANSNEKDKALSDVAAHAQEELDKLKKILAEDLSALKDQRSKKLITQEAYNKAVSDVNQKGAEAEQAINEEKGLKTLEVEKKYHEIIRQFVLNATTDTFTQKRASINKEYDDLLKVADEKEKDVLRKLKASKLLQVDREEKTATTLIRTETKSINTKVDNRVLETDDPEIRRKKLSAINAADVEVENAAFQNKLTALAGHQDEIEQATAQHNQRITELADQHARDDKAIDDAKKEAKLSTLSEIGEGLNLLSDIAGKNTVAGKALAVADTTIDTYVSASKAYKSQLTLATPDAPVRAAIAAGVAIAQGLLKVKSILAVKVPTKGGSGSGGGSAPTITTAPTITATATGAASQQVQDVRVTNQQDQVVKAYVSDRDLKSNEDKSNFLNKLSTI